MAANVDVAFVDDAVKEDLASLQSLMGIKAVDDNKVEQQKDVSLKKAGNHKELDGLSVEMRNIEILSARKKARDRQAAQKAQLSGKKVNPSSGIKARVVKQSGGKENMGSSSKVKRADSLIEETNNLTPSKRDSSNSPSVPTSKNIPKMSLAGSELSDQATENKSEIEFLKRKLLRAERMADPEMFSQCRALNISLQNEKSKVELLANSLKDKSQKYAEMSASLRDMKNRRTVDTALVESSQLHTAVAEHHVKERGRILKDATSTYKMRFLNEKCKHWELVQNLSDSKHNIFELNIENVEHRYAIEQYKDQLSELEDRLSSTTNALHSTIYQRDKLAGLARNLTSYGDEVAVKLSAVSKERDDLLQRLRELEGVVKEVTIDSEMSKKNFEALQNNVDEVEKTKIQLEKQLLAEKELKKKILMECAEEKHRVEEFKAKTQVLENEVEQEKKAKSLVEESTKQLAQTIGESVDEKIRHNMTKLLVTQQLKSLPVVAAKHTPKSRRRETNGNDNSRIAENTMGSPTPSKKLKTPRGKTTVCAVSGTSVDTTPSRMTRGTRSALKAVIEETTTTPAKTKLRGSRPKFMASTTHTPVKKPSPQVATKGTKKSAGRSSTKTGNHSPDEMENEEPGAHSSPSPRFTRSALKSTQPKKRVKRSEADKTQDSLEPCRTLKSPKVSLVKNSKSINSKKTTPAKLASAKKKTDGLDGDQVTERATRRSTRFTPAPKTCTKSPSSKKTATPVSRATLKPQSSKKRPSPAYVDDDPPSPVDEDLPTRQTRRRAVVEKPQPEHNPEPGPKRQRKLAPRKESSPERVGQPARRLRMRPAKASSKGLFSNFLAVQAQAPKLKAKRKK
mmetsp:Transcript_7996/g.14650  ORF Transcript_7996/g.14650 Transcript_7996/m.14650 type:complete len:851 (-) Transcript_7996:43-2595(-)